LLLAIVGVLKAFVDTQGDRSRRFDAALSAHAVVRQPSKCESSRRLRTACSRLAIRENLGHARAFGKRRKRLARLPLQKGDVSLSGNTRRPGLLPAGNIPRRSSNRGWHCKLLTVPPLRAT
jgi:hypothetical protein